MTVEETVELGLIISSTGAIFVFSLGSSHYSLLANLLLNAASLLLLQGLVRDLWILFKCAKKNQISSQKMTHASCLCVESSVGLIGIAIGLTLLFSSAEYAFYLTPFMVALLSGVVLVFGFFIKDFVIQWRPWRIYKMPNHVNIVFQWKGKQH